MQRKNFKNFESVNICDICNSNEKTLFLEVKDRNYKTGNFKYWQCEKCGLVWLSPRPVLRNLAKYYPKNAYRAYRPHSRPNFLQKTIRRLIKENEIIAKILIKDELFFWKDKGKILDVGTGSGVYMKVLEGWGWQVSGLDWNPHAVKIAKQSGIDKIRQGDLLNAKYPSGSFNAVRSSYVLEHVSSATKEMLEMKRILKPKGHVILYVPNIDSIFFKLFKSYWYPLEPPRHFYQFSPATVKNLLRITGFKNIRIRYLQSPYPVIWSLLYYLGLSGIDKRIGLITYPIALILRFASFIRRSDLIEVIAQK